MHKLRYQTSRSIVRLAEVVGDDLAGQHLHTIRHLAYFVLLVSEGEAHLALAVDGLQAVV